MKFAKKEGMQMTTSWAPTIALQVDQLPTHAVVRCVMCEAAHVWLSLACDEHGNRVCSCGVVLLQRIA